MSIRVGSYVMWPLMTGLMVISGPFVRLVFTDKWLPCVPFMQIACIQYALEPVQTANVQAVKAMGKGRTFLLMEIVKKSFGVVMIVAVMYRGVMAIAVTAMVVTFFAAVVNSTPNRKYLGYTYQEQAADLYPSVLLSAAMAVCVWFAGKIPLPPAAGIAVQVVAGIAVYVLLSRVFRVSQFTYLTGVAKSFMHSFHKEKK